MEAESGRDTDRRLLDALLPLSPPPRRPLRPAARLYSAQHLHWVLGRERSRADRTGQEFSLVMLSAAAEGATARRVMHRLARVLAGRARATDEVGHFDETRLCAVLPGTNALGAASFARDVCEQARAKGLAPTCVLYTYPSNWAARDDAGGDERRSNSSGGARVETTQRWTTAGEARAGLSDMAVQGFLEEMRGTGGVRSAEELLALPLPWWKRALDLAGAGLLVAVAWPVMLAAAVAIKVASPGPVLFMQRRAGFGGVPFTIFKFRTMVIGAEAQRDELKAMSEQDGPAFKMRDDPRVTRVGQFLRKTSLDELPQLFNVLKGDMSLVGPRPLPMKESDACQPWHRRRLEITPGLTCIWQVKGRSTVSFDDWVRMDMQYLRRRTLMHDLKLLLLTVPAVVLRRGAH